MATKTKKRGVGNVPRKKAPMKSKFSFGVFLSAIGGGVVAQVIVKKLPIENKLVKIGVPALMGAYLTSNKNPMLAAAGFGMVSVAGGQAIGAIVPAISGDGSGMLDGIFDFLDVTPTLNESEAEDVMFLNGVEEETLDGSEFIAESTFIAGAEMC
jgi:hypothetical protein